jgi:hypothetical protein
MILNDTDTAQTARIFGHEGVIPRTDHYLGHVPSDQLCYCTTKYHHLDHPIFLRSAVHNGSTFHFEGTVVDDYSIEPYSEIEP